MTTAKALRAAEARYQRASRAVDQAREHRDALIRQAASEGMSHAEIQRAVGALSRARIGQIAR